MPVARILVFGGGGHAKVVIEILQFDSRNILVGIIDKNPQLARSRVLGVPVLGDDGQIAGAGADAFCVGIGSIGVGSLRARVFDEARARGLSPVTAVHPAATVSASAQLGAGTVVMAGAVINPGVVLAQNVIINTGAVVDHDCRIGDHAHVAPGAVLSGGVTVGRRSLVGVGATVMQGVSIGDDAVVGAGAVVVRDVPPGVTVAGVPARIHAPATEVDRVR